MAAPLLRARSLVKGYRTPAGEVPVLRGVDLDVAEGEMVAVVGSSGVGKSTLLHVLGTLDRPDSGSLEVAGEDVLALAEPARCAFRNRTLGFVFQFHHLLPEFTALENVAMPLLVGRRPAGEAFERALALLDELGLGGRADHRPGALSGGEQQRVAVARALVRDPHLILADEPTGNLDDATGEVVMALLDRVTRKAGRTLVLVTHSPQVAAMADRVLGIEEGHVVPLAPPAGSSR
jgi:lipoprotein-releasing system ATP-binding protein